MSTRRVTAAELRRMPIGSLAAHEQLQAACLTFLRLNMRSAAAPGSPEAMATYRELGSAVRMMRAARARGAR